MHFNFYLLFSFGLFSLIQCEKTKKSGEEIADALYSHPKECKDPSDGGIWAPLAAGQSCGGHDCKYPDQWCSARSSSKSVPQLNCVKLPEECKKALKNDEMTTTTTTASPSSPSPPPPESAEKPSSKEEPATEHPTTTTQSPGSSEEHPERTGGEELSRKEKNSQEAAPAPAPQPAEECKDSNALCCFWASHLHPGGTECDRNAAWMRTTCPKSCGTCGCKASTFYQCKVKVNVEGCPYLRSGAQNLVFVPLANRGGNAGFQNAAGNLVVPLGAGGGGFGFNRAFASGPVQVPLGNVNPAFGRGGPSPVLVPLG